MTRFVIIPPTSMPSVKKRACEASIARQRAFGLPIVVFGASMKGFVNGALLSLVVPLTTYLDSSLETWLSGSCLAVKRKK